MRVTDIRCTVFAHPMPPLHGARWSSATQEITIVEVETDSGITGIGSARAQAGTGGRVIAESIMKTAAPRVLGQQALNRERIWQALAHLERAGYLPIFATSAIDVALWDVAGKALGVPVHKLLGGCRDTLPAYASSAHMPTVDDYLREVDDIRARGYRAYKIHPPGKPDVDVDVCRAVRRQVGPDFTLMLDPGGAYGRDDALRVGRELERLGFAWYEEPLRDWDFQGYADLCRSLDIPVQAGEVVPGHAYLATEFIVRGAGDHLRADVYWKGGITGVMKMAALTEAFNVPLELHHAASPIMEWANLHCALAIPHCRYFEVLVPEKRYTFGLHAYAQPNTNGDMAAPETPGIGASVDWEWVRAHAVE